MENASKALLMAAGMLIGILVLTLAVYLFINFGGTSARLHEQMRQSEIQKFNAQFTIYENKEEVTIYDIVSVANLASENNIYYELDDGDSKNYYVSVKLGTESLEKKTKSELEALIRAKLQEGKSYIVYKCDVKISPTTQRVYEVKFSE